MKVCKYEIKAEEAVIETDEGMMKLEAIRPSVIRCCYTKKKEFLEPSEIVSGSREPGAGFAAEETPEKLVLKTGKIRLEISKEHGSFCWQDEQQGRIWLEEGGKLLAEEDVTAYTTGGEPPVVERVKTVDGERSFIKNLKQEKIRKAYRGKLLFHWQEGEGIFGLGQAEEGIYNYRGHNQYLYQHNMRIPIPFFVSDRGYGILVDCGSLMLLQSDQPDSQGNSNGGYLLLDTVGQLDYYFIGGSCLDEIIADYRYLTGRAAMLPKWSFGYVQSREAYRTQQEVLDTAAEYRRRQIPIDCIVQDWNTWEAGEWGQKTVDKERYPDLKGMNEKLHQMHIHSMISIWPNMNPGGRDHEELFAAGHLLNDYSTYNAFSEEARQMYWEQADRELFSSGFDSWWCDSTEPFSGPDWNGQMLREPWERYALVGGEHKKYLAPEQANLFAFYHAKGIFENQRRVTKDKRVLNLTRSGYAGSQRFGTMLWSGDTCATWENFRKQIVEGLNFGISGMPYWTWDIGAFFTVGSAWWNRGCNCSSNPDPIWFWQGDYNEGAADLGYRELYVRWLEVGTFVPMFRSHGTDTPREIWNFGTAGEPFYDAIEKFIRLRYRLMPYIYSLAGAVHLEHRTIMRSLLFDFRQDQTAVRQKDCFMFGPSVLVCAVTEPMYYEAGNQAIQREKTKRCYLPQGTDWYDYWNGEKYTGGQWLDAAAPLDQIPLFIRAGAIIPMMEGLSYAQEDEDAEVPRPMEILVYPGADGSFTLYEDEGDNYNYEQDCYSLIPIQWHDTEQKLVIGKRRGRYAGMKAEREFIIKVETKLCNPPGLNPEGNGTLAHSGSVWYNGEELCVFF